MLYRPSTSTSKRLLHLDPFRLWSLSRLYNDSSRAVATAATVSSCMRLRSRINIAPYLPTIITPTRKFSSTLRQDEGPSERDETNLFDTDVTTHSGEDFESRNKLTTDMFDPDITVKPSEGFKPGSDSTPASVPIDRSRDIYKQAAVHAKARRLPQAWQKLNEYLKLPGASPSSPDFVRACNIFLFSATRADPSHKYSADVLADLVDLGFSPNIVTYTILVRNAISIKDPATAWNIYNMVRSYGIEPDDGMYCVMLSMCRHTGDLDAYKRIFYQHINPQARTHIDSRLVTEVLIGNSWLHVNGQYRFEHQLKLYERFCDLKPLKHLGILPQGYISRYRGWQSSSLPAPHSWALHVMIRLYLLREKRLSVVDRVFTKFFERVEAADPQFLPLLQTGHIYTTFLKVLTRWPIVLGLSPGPTFSQRGDPKRPHLNWRSIFKKIAAPPPPYINPETGRPLPQLRPDTHHWTTIANAYAHAGRVPESEAILKIMRDNRHEIPVATWDALTTGFARRKNIPHMASLLFRMTEKDIKPTEYTVAALQKLEGKDKLLGIIHEFQERAKTPDGTQDPRIQPSHSELFIDETKKEGW